jgi:hypothetical protein
MNHLVVTRKNFTSLEKHSSFLLLCRLYGRK